MAEAVSVTWSGLDDLQSKTKDILSQIAESIQNSLGDTLEKIQRESYDLTPFDPNNPHTGTEELKIVKPRLHKGTMIPPADLHIQRGAGEDTGHLRDTAAVDVLWDESQQTVFGQISYTSEYAVYQHEDLSLNHPNGGQGKYLEQPWLEHQSDMLEEIGQGVIDDSSSN